MDDLQPVTVTLQGGDVVDRAYWHRELLRFLRNQPCDLEHTQDTIRIYPNASND